MSLFFTQYNCLDCQYEWVGQSGIVGMQSMGEVYTCCPKCNSNRLEWEPYSFPPKDVPHEATLAIKVYRATPTAKLPTKAYDDDLGWDLYADMKYYTHDGAQHPNLVSPWYVEGGATTRIKTGLHIELPKGYGAVMKPRSSQGSANLDIYAGVEDQGYRGEWVVCVHNSNMAPYYIQPGEKIGQFILIENPKSEIVEVQSFGQLSASERGQKGFGSSGK